MFISPKTIIERPPTLINDKVAVARWNTSFALATNASGAGGMALTPAAFHVACPASATTTAGFGISLGVSTFVPSTGSLGGTYGIPIAAAPSGLTTIMGKVMMVAAEVTVRPITALTTSQGYVQMCLVRNMYPVFSENTVYDTYNK
jgi:hypothetical protein